MNAALKLVETTVPAAPEIEIAVLGALMLAPCWHEVADLLSARMFSVDAHAKLFACVEALAKRADPVDIITVSNEAKSRGWLEAVGGKYFVSTLTNGIPSGVNVRTWALIVTQKFIAREIMCIAEAGSKAAMDPTADVFDTLAGMQLDLLRLNEVGQADEVNAAEVARKVVDPLPDRGVPTHFLELDKVLRFEPGTVTIVGGRPGMGKTAFAISLLWRQAMMGGKPFIASMEMTAVGLMNRLICGECGVPVWKAKRRMITDVESERLARFAQDHNAPISAITIDESPTLDTQSFLARLDRAKRKHGITIGFVDYLQLMNVRGERFKSRYDRVTAVSEQLRIIAKQTDIPLVALSQLSRSEKGAVVRRPTISDLRESGQIEQDAEAIMLLHRPAYYDKAASNELEVIVAKNRDGADRIVSLAFDCEGVRVVDPPTLPHQPTMHAVRNHTEPTRDDSPF